MCRICLPEGAKRILGELDRRGFEAYVVGGCVRDSLLSLSPKDWDICTSATPGEVKASFEGQRIIETGLKHGTVTLLWENQPYEITTFRTEGGYSDRRRPDSVCFVKELREDLARRDFTVNAMAYHPQRGLVDLFGGREHLRRGILACVGEPRERFDEDALRILRALRFSARFGFSVEEKTAAAIHEMGHLLQKIAAERISSELKGLLLGKDRERILRDYQDVMARIIPELSPCIGFAQNNPHHDFTVYEHLIRAVGVCEEKDFGVKLSLLLHDVGKPLCYTESEGVGHFYGHARLSEELAERVCLRLKLDTQTKEQVLQLVHYHDGVLEPRSAGRWLCKLGEERLRQLLEVKVCDILAQKEQVKKDRLEELEAFRRQMEEGLRQKQCFSLKELAIGGEELLALGIPKGREIGQLLKEALLQVVDGVLPNEKEALLSFVKERTAGKRQ